MRHLRFAHPIARVAELADARDSKSRVPLGRVGSTPTSGITDSSFLWILSPTATAPRCFESAIQHRAEGNLAQRRRDAEKRQGQQKERMHWLKCWCFFSRPLISLTQDAEMQRTTLIQQYPLRPCSTAHEGHEEREQLYSQGSQPSGFTLSGSSRVSWSRILSFLGASAGVEVSVEPLLSPLASPTQDAMIARKCNGA